LGLPASPDSGASSVVRRIATGSAQLQNCDVTRCLPYHTCYSVYLPFQIKGFVSRDEQCFRTISKQLRVGDPDLDTRDPHVLGLPDPDPSLFS
jgi:hypothetical protein